MTKEITVIDSIMGSGKTQWAIQYMNEAPELEKFIYVTPFLDEVTRIKNSVTNRTFTEPNNANDEGRKLRSLKELIVQGEDITSTHSLFKTADDELIELLNDSGYTLILDEVMDCVATVNAGASDIRKLERASDIEITENKVVWTGDPQDNSRYMDIRMVAQAGNLFYYRGKFLVWAFPPAVFHAVDDVKVMTYLFDGQTQRYYFDLYGFEYDYRAITKIGDRYEITEYDPERERRGELYSLINVYEGKMNDIGSRKNALSVSYLQRISKAGNVDFLKKMQNNLKNYFQNVVKAKRDEVYYSTLKEIETAIQPKGYKEPKRPSVKTDRTPKVVIPHNARATNAYAEKWALAYMFNRYMKQDIKVFFQDNGISVNDDLLAVSDLLQWIYRSRIRNGEPIELYLPSRRMRDLLEAWAKYEI
ncbi:hypothetical protein QNH47_06250 [Virgibacillus halodenitrificans]|uniref:hypothetical protein n=1 Tax=Virgibacillus halodenitrificans TaxID=1482 RepID=UPI0024C052E7|nr:hypothetical protein [Virgibacillus halodenitrificans]WHX27454.1 hypothetical protein QNH47_06250 [Virgibacillus halodenitrificans]